ncbi:acyl-CoA thioesterase [Anthocerotibacter panamensis]|uniref:acyl-CoA thioesterase n=1 Tax=Anthocerotibacter panamensis TaxID=2857077 RepID=UPI001C403734|nr:thioesterase family protein [Anthocerotibacter panamensis]
MSQRQTFPIKVYYADTDSAGIVYYANYMRWMEMARCEFLEHLGTDVPGIQAGGVVVVVARAGLTYHKPGRFGDRLELVVWTSEVTGLSFKFNYQFLRPEAHGSTLLVEAHTLMVCVDSTDFRLLPVPRVLLPLLEQSALP